ncbi:MAG: sigma 54-interacting transcriptional regulator [Thalassotalea sp.]|nr:sigma 54-interacting transcriptional regulator [Thalassotalea sp.]
MRFEIQVLDQVGISEKILRELSTLRLNIVAMEVASGLIYLHLSSTDINFEELKSHLLKVSDVKAINAIDLLPTESREQHLKALLRRIPDPIFDIDSSGVILSCNYAAHIYVGQHVEKLFNIPLENIKQRKTINVEVNFEDQPYLAEMTPLWSMGDSHHSQGRVSNVRESNNRKNKALERGFNGAVVILTSLNRVGQQLSQFQRNEGEGRLENILGSSEGIIALKQQIHKFSVLDLPILISGETGTGKELVARAIHSLSHRSDGPFLAINCASLPEQLLESELFGYVAGAFTGASSQGKPGLFELAQGGTVFLDEVAEMSVYLQAKLLRFLQDYSFRRLGATKESVANVRIISASHQPFETLMKSGDFREDLFYRLNVLSVQLPALREREGDIDILSRYFLKTAAEQVNLPEPKLSQAAYERLAQYPWPGNIRQLQNVMFRLVALSTAGEINASTIENVMGELSAYPQAGRHQIKDSKGSQEAKSLDHYNDDWDEVDSWQQAQKNFELKLLSALWPEYKSTRKLAQRLQVSHNKIAMKLREHGIS